MPVSKIPTSYRDKVGQMIFEGDICRSWIKDENIEPNLGHWLFEKVLFYEDDWYLFEVGFNYEKSTDLPSKLSNFHKSIEVANQVVFPNQ